MKFISLIIILSSLAAAIAGRASSKEESVDFSPAVKMPSARLSTLSALTKIALGSCFHPRQDSKIFNEIRLQSPDLFVFLGDNVYASNESDDPKLMSLRNAYYDLSQVESFRALRESTPLMVTWDDHDYGKDDAGGDFKHRVFSESLFRHVWDIKPLDQRASRPGVYFERSIGPNGKKVQLIVLDTRSFRTPLTMHPNQDEGKYIQSQDPQQSMLGVDQWMWLAEQLSKPAEIRIILSSIQLIAQGHHWESWQMMPREREKLLSLLASLEANGVIVVSGDRHFAAIYELAIFESYPLYELTTSSLNVPLISFVRNPIEERGPNRLTKPFYESNYGLIEIDWGAGEVSLKLMDQFSDPIAKKTVNIKMLRKKQNSQLQQTKPPGVKNRNLFIDETDT